LFIPTAAVFSASGGIARKAAAVLGRVVVGSISTVSGE